LKSFFFFSIQSFPPSIVFRSSRPRILPIAGWLLPFLSNALFCGGGENLPSESRPFFSFSFRRSLLSGPFQSHQSAYLFFRHRPRISLRRGFLPFPTEDFVTFLEAAQSFLSFKESGDRFQKPLREAPLFSERLPTYDLCNPLITSRSFFPKGQAKGISSRFQLSKNSSRSLRHYCLSPPAYVTSHRAGFLVFPPDPSFGTLFSFSKH